MKKRMIAAVLTAALCVPMTASAWSGRGDLNADQCIDAFDLALMKREFYGNKDSFEDYFEPSSYPEEADVNANDAFTPYDIVQMQNFLLGRIDDFSEAPLVSGEKLTPDEDNLEQGRELNPEFLRGQMAFAADLFKKSAQNEKNTMISPLSVSIALSMAANGAKGQTCTEMEEVLGSSVEEINEYMAYYITNIGYQRNARVNIANSIWLRDDERLTVEEAFLDANSRYYDAEVFKAPFDDGTVQDINNWVKNETDGMIPKLVNELSADTMSVLLNAIAFDAEWADKYEDYQVKDGIFTAADGTAQDVEMMHGGGDEYYEFDNAVGFSKAYEGRKYRFVAILPDEDMTVSEWIAQMDGEAVLAELGDPSLEYEVITQTPKFKYETDLKLKEMLSDMGMPTAFDRMAADFSGMAHYTENGVDYPLYISEVLHKTFIDLNETGTRAAAVTAVMMLPGAAPDFEEPVYKYITLDRPFVYMIVDNNDIPLFMGTVQDLG